MTTDRRSFLHSTALAASALWVQSNLASAADNKKYKACIIGDSRPDGDFHVGYGHRLDAVFANRKDTVLTAVSDPVEETRERAMEQFDLDKGYADYQEMLEKEKPDLVSIGTRRPARHRELCLAALQAGAHIFVEKPFADTLEAADEIIAAAEKNNLKIAVAHQMRPHPSIQHVKKCLQDWLIGELVEIRSRGKEDHRAGGEDLMVLGTHNFDMIQFFVGQPQWCMASVLQDGRPIIPADVHEVEEELGPIAGNDISAMYGLESGVTAYFGSKKTADGNQGRWGMDLYGTKGIISIRMNQKPHVAYFNGPSWAPMADGQKQTGEWLPLPDDPGKDMPGGLEALIANNSLITDDLIAAIEEGRRPKVGGHEARTALEMILAAYASQIAGAKVDLPLKDRRHPLAVFAS